jgi:acetyl-CoA C-acetyltransferase
MDERLPIVVGVGQLADRSDDLATKREPLALIAEAARSALADAEGGNLARRIDSVRVVNMLSGAAYPDPAGMLAARLGLESGERLYTTIGGNAPQWLVNRSADDLAAGRCRAVLIAGGEALHTLRLASKQRIDLAWSHGRGGAVTVGDGRQGSDPDEWRYGLQMPTQIYPLFEVALRAHERRAPAAHRVQVARLSASLAAIAATHPHAWFRDGKSAAEIESPGPTNRMIAYPYTKFMTSIIEVDQAAAVIMTTVGEARALGIPPSRWVYIHGGGETHDLWYLKDRVDYHSSPGMAEAMRQALAQATIEPSGLTFVDLYSCFPVAVEIAARTLGLPSDGSRPLSVTGGLPYFGGAGNNYALHAIVTTIERARATPGAFGLVSALGWYLTKHAVGIYGSDAPRHAWMRSGLEERQHAIDALHHPRFVDACDGGGTVETYTVLHDRDGAMTQAIAFVRRDDGSRTLALVDDVGVLATFEREEMVGAPGVLSVDADGRNRFRPRGA